MTDWIKHNSNEPPALAEAAFVLRRTAPGAGPRAVVMLPWGPGVGYSVVTDPSGTPYCSAEGLEPWAEYVATDPCGCCVRQFSCLPYEGETLMWRRSDLNAKFGFAPDTHRHPGDWRDSLYRVWRGEE